MKQFAALVVTIAVVGMMTLTGCSSDEFLSANGSESVSSFQKDENNHNKDENNHNKDENNHNKDENNHN